MPFTNWLVFLLTKDHMSTHWMYISHWLIS